MISGYIYANAGEGESTTDVVFGGHNIIAENGTILEETKRFVNETIYSEFDIERIVSERRKNTTFQMSEDYNELIHVPFSLDVVDTELTRKIAASPFVPNDEYYVEEYSYAEEQGIDRCKSEGDYIPLRSKLCLILGVNLGVKNKKSPPYCRTEGFLEV